MNDKKEIFDESAVLLICDDLECPDCEGALTMTDLDVEDYGEGVFQHTTMYTCDNCGAVYTTEVEYRRYRAKAYRG